MAKDRAVSLKLTDHLRRQLEEVSKKSKTADLAREAGLNLTKHLRFQIEEEKKKAKTAEEGREAAEAQLEAVKATREAELDAAITTAEATRVAELEAAFKAAEMPTILEEDGRSESPSGVEEAEVEVGAANETKSAASMPAAPPTFGVMATCSASGGLGVSCSDKLNELRGKLRKETARAVLRLWFASARYHTERMGV